MAHELSKATAVDVSVDAVIMNQKQVVGPDRARLARTYSVMRNAEHDTAVAVINLQSIPCEVAGTGDSTESMAAADQLASRHSQIQSYLVSAGTKYVATAGDAYKDRLYRKVRQRQATILARRLKAATPEQFMRTLQYLVSQPKTTIKPA